jgi:hypothetical protein
MDLQAPSSRLQQLELEHADEGQKIDIKRSDALATDLSNVERGYFFSPQIIGSIAAVSLAVLYVSLRNIDLDRCFATLLFGRVLGQKYPVEDSIRLSAVVHHQLRLPGLGKNEQS